MAPWMVIAAIGLVGLGLLVVAPQLHRRSLDRAEERTESARRERIRELENRAEVSRIVIADATRAQSIHRQLLLRGVRTHLVDGAGGTEIVFESRYGDVVEEIRRTAGDQ